VRVDVKGEAHLCVTEPLTDDLHVDPAARR
jgi:hypothetical protein